MQLTRFTDLGLRVLMYLNGPTRDRPCTIAEIAARFQVSHHHLTKVVHFMGQQGWVLTSRGKGGGLALAKTPDQYPLGQLIHTLEGADSQLVDCEQPLCMLHQCCGLKTLLDSAHLAFYQHLDRYTLADTLTEPTRSVILMLHRQAPADLTPLPVL